MRSEPAKLRLLAIAMLLVAAIIWGLAFVAQKTSMQNGLGAITFMAGRFVLGLLTVAPIALIAIIYSGRNSPERRATSGSRVWSVFFRTDIVKAAFVPAVMLFLALLTQQLGIVYTSASNASILTALYIIFTPMVAWMFFRDQIGVEIWISALITFVGVFFLGKAQFSSLGVGDYLVILSAVITGVYIVLLARAVEKVGHTMLLSMWQFVIGGILSFIGVYLFEDFSWSEVKANSTELLYTGIVSTGIAFSLFTLAQRWVSASISAIVGSTESFFGALFAALLLAERLTPIQYTGCLLILMGVFYAEAGPSAVRWSSFHAFRFRDWCKVKFG